MDPLRAGAAQREVTPGKSLFLYGYPHVQRYSEGSHDPLYASALVLDNGIRKIALCAIDVVGVSKEMTRQIRGRVCEDSDLQEADITVSCSHTHSGPQTEEHLLWADDEVIPPVDRDYVDDLIDSVAAVILEAGRNTSPCSLAVTTTDAGGVGGNRRSQGGAVDAEVSVLVVRTAEGQQILAVVTAYCMHPTVLHEDSRLYSADFPGYTRQVLNRALGEDLVYLYQTGPEGNQSPRRFISANTFAEAERLGTLLGERILASVREIERYDTDIVLDAERAELMLSLRDLPSLAQAQARLAEVKSKFERLQRIAAPQVEVRTAECDVFGAEGELTLAKYVSTGRVEQVLAQILPVELQVLRVGEHYFAFVPGELFVEYSLLLKSRVEDPIYTICLANGGTEGYIVTEEAYAAGGYEAWTSLFPPRAGARIVATLIQLQRKLKEKDEQ